MSKDSETNPGLCYVQWKEKNCCDYTVWQDLVSVALLLQPVLLLWMPQGFFSYIGPCCSAWSLACSEYKVEIFRVFKPPISLSMHTWFLHHLWNVFIISVCLFVSIYYYDRCLFVCLDVTMPESSQTFEPSSWVLVPPESPWWGSVHISCFTIFGPMERKVLISISEI